MIPKTFAKLGKRFFWSTVFLLHSVIIFAADQPVPQGAPPDFAPPAGPPPPPPLPIDDYIFPAIIFTLFVVYLYKWNKNHSLDS